MSEPTLSAAAVRRIEQHYEQLKNELLELGWISQGSLMRQLPNAWRWTYKVKTKTVTVALSKEQAELYQKAIASCGHAAWFASWNRCRFESVERESSFSSLSSSSERSSAVLRKYGGFPRYALCRFVLGSEQNPHPRGISTRAQVFQAPRPASLRQHNHLGCTLSTGLL